MTLADNGGRAVVCGEAGYEQQARNGWPYESYAHALLKCKLDSE